jgi:hypothetical protein
MAYQLHRERRNCWLCCFDDGGRAGEIYGRLRVAVGRVLRVVGRDKSELELK